MPKSKTSSRTVKKSAKTKVPRKTGTRSKKTAAPVSASRPQKTTSSSKVAAARQNYTEEYRDYLERYALAGEGRPRLSPAEFDQYDEELLDLLDPERGPLNDEQIVRLQELEFLLIDSEM